jgi:LL-H family phage holin
MSAQVTASVIFIVGMFIAVLAALYLWSLFKQRLPEHTRLALEQFARQAVWHVEQTGGGLSGPAKKQMAVSAVMKLFAAFGLPAPAAGAIDIAIEAAVFLLSRMYTSAVESGNPPKIEPPKQG